MTFTPPTIILAGGQGTRLRPVLADRPKPMASVCGRPFLEWLLLSLRRQGVRHVILATGHLGHLIENHFGDGAAWDLHIDYSNESHPLGTAGAIRLAAEKIAGEQMLVLNGDSYCRLDIVRLLQMHKARAALATMWLVPMQDCRRYGAVTLGANGAVNAFREKSALSAAGLINAGAYLLERRLVREIPTGRAVSFEGEILPRWIGAGLCGVVGPRRFLDIGTPESYGHSQQFFREENAFSERIEPAKELAA